jgi:hypothetical protein
MKHACALLLSFCTDRSAVRWLRSPKESRLASDEAVSSHDLRALASLNHQGFSFVPSGMRMPLWTHFTEVSRHARGLNNSVASAKPTSNNHWLLSGR